MKTIDGHEVKKGRIYYLVLCPACSIHGLRAEHILGIKVVKCRCTKVGAYPAMKTIYWGTRVKRKKEIRIPYATVKSTDPLQTTERTFYYNEASKYLFKDLAKAQNYCLEKIAFIQDCFQEVCDQATKEILRENKKCSSKSQQ